MRRHATAYSEVYNQARTYIRRSCPNGGRGASSRSHEWGGIRLDEEIAAANERREHPVTRIFERPTATMAPNWSFGILCKMGAYI
jgi:hypothetical protein